MQSLRSGLRWSSVALVLALLAGTVGVKVEAARAAEPSLKVFVFAGTSNLSSGSIAELADDLKQPRKDVLVYQESGWVPLEPGKAPLRGNGKNFGPEVTFAQTMTKHLGEPIGIIRAGLISVAPEPRGSYAQLVSKVKEAQKSRSIVIAGLLIQAGERDGYTEALARAFPKNMSRLIESARRDFGNPAMPIAINRAIPNQGAFRYVDLVRKAESALDLPGFRVVDCDDVPRGGDKVHYTSKGQLEFGKRFAAAMIELLKADKAKNQDP